MHLLLCHVPRRLHFHFTEALRPREHACVFCFSLWPMFNGRICPIFHATVFLLPRPRLDEPHLRPMPDLVHVADEHVSADGQRVAAEGALVDGGLVR